VAPFSVAVTILFQVIRENLDLGRPKQMQSILDRSVTKATPGPFRTRVITDGVIASLHIDYKGTRIKQYHKEGQALRTETPSMTRATFTSARVLSTCRHCAGSGFRPTAVCWKYRPSPTTRSLPKKSCNNSGGPASSRVNG
jgi:hypothetical protein